MGSQKGSEVMARQDRGKKRNPSDKPPGPGSWACFNGVWVAIQSWEAEHVTPSPIGLDAVTAIVSSDRPTVHLDPESN